MKLLVVFFILCAIASCTNNSEKQQIPEDPEPVGSSTKPDTSDVAILQEENIETDKQATNSGIPAPINSDKITSNKPGPAADNNPSSNQSTPVTPKKESLKTDPPVPATEPVKTKPSKLPSPKPVPAGNSLDPPSHDSWEKLLVKYVSDGKVNYKGFKSEKGFLENYLYLLSNNPVREDWSRNEKMAYWINAYNAATIKLIVDNYPVSSIMKLDGGKPFDVKRITLGDKKYSLNDIENDILRPQFKEPRIHFAINCAAMSCPPLLNHAWTASNLNSYLESQAKKFVNDSRYNQIKPNSIKISRIFDWYGEDFGNLVGFLNKYSDVSVNHRGKISFLEYNWDLNE